MAATSLIDALPSFRLIIECSLWSADLLRIGDDLARIEPHADVVHIDVSDGHFTPALLFFPDMVHAVRQATSLPIHVHLMVSDEILLSQIEEFAGAGADVISIHLENDRVADAALARIEELEVATGMALQIESDVSALETYLDRLHFVTILGTRPGIKGVEPDGRAPERLRKVAAMIDRQETDRRVVLAADGGIRRHTVPVLRRSGADSVVAGSLVFGAPDLAERISWLRSL